MSDLVSNLLMCSIMIGSFWFIHWRYKPKRNNPKAICMNVDNAFWEYSKLFSEVWYADEYTDLEGLTNKILDYRNEHKSKTYTEDHFQDLMVRLQKKEVSLYLIKIQKFGSTVSGL